MQLHAPMLDVAVAENFAGTVTECTPWASIPAGPNSRVLPPTTLQVLLIGFFRLFQHFSWPVGAQKEGVTQSPIDGQNELPNHLQPRRHISSLNDLHTLPCGHGPRHGSVSAPCPGGRPRTVTVGNKCKHAGMCARVSQHVNVPTKIRDVDHHTATHPDLLAWLGSSPAKNHHSTLSLRLLLLPLFRCRPAGLWRMVTLCQYGSRKRCQRLWSWAAGCSNCTMVRKHGRLTCAPQCHASCWTRW